MSPNLERVRQLFADQFEADGADFLYRKSMKGAPIRITSQERDNFVAAFNRRVRYAIWSVIPTMPLLIIVLALQFPEADSPAAQAPMYIGLALILAPILLIFLWAWYAPARELSGRPAVGEARTREDVRQRMFAKLTYGQLAIAAASAPLLIWKISAKNDVWHGWGILWLVFAALIVAMAGAQAVRKWLYEHH